jgi:hypothetical protein
MISDKAFETRDLEEERTDGADSALRPREREPKEATSSPRRRQLGQKDFERVVKELDLDRVGADVLDCLLDRGRGPQDFRELSFLICGIFDSPDEQLDMVRRVGELAKRCIAVG